MDIKDERFLGGIPFTFPKDYQDGVNELLTWMGEMGDRGWTAEQVATGFLHCFIQMTNDLIPTPKLKENFIQESMALVNSWYSVEQEQ